MLQALLDPKIGFVFKQIFGYLKHPRVLISFLNATLKPIFPITEVEIKNTVIEKEFLDDKFSRLDVKATTSNHEVINIEIQLKNEYDMVQEAVLTRNIPECKKFIRDFVKRVEVYNDHLEVTFNMAFSLSGVIDYTYIVSKLIKEFWHE